MIVTILQQRPDRRRQDVQHFSLLLTEGQTSANATARALGVLVTEVKLESGVPVNPAAFHAVESQLRPLLGGRS